MTLGGIACDIMDGMKLGKASPLGFSTFPVDQPPLAKDDFMNELIVGADIDI